MKARFSQLGIAGALLIVGIWWLVSKSAPPPDPPDYPGESWLILGDLDVDAACAAVIAHGGAIVRTPKDTPEFSVRSAVVTDPDGHHIELTGAMPAGA